MEAHPLDRIMDGFGVGRWLPLLGPRSFATRLLPLARAEAAAYLRRCAAHEIVGGRVRARETAAPVDEETRALLGRLESRITEALAEFGGQGFVKLSSRSAKDSVFDMKSERTEALLKEELARIDWTAVPEELRDNQEVACFFRAANKAMCVKNGQEAMRLFYESARIQTDLNRALKRDDTEDFDVQIVVRQFVPDITLESEFRGFVEKGKLTAVSQYFHFLFFPSLVQQRDSILTSLNAFFVEEIKPLLDEKYDTYVIDFAWTQEKIWVIELNPSGENTGASLFHWKKDAAILHDVNASVPVLRLVEKPDPNVRDRALVPVWDKWLMAWREEQEKNNGKCIVA